MSELWEWSMAYCTKCGTKNKEIAEYCVKCGAKLKMLTEESLEKRIEKGAEEFGRQAEKWGDEFGKRAEEECFGLPHGGTIIGMIFGIIIIFAGLSWLLGFEFWEDFWPLIVIIFGVLIIAGALYGLRRRR